MITKKVTVNSSTLTTKKFIERLASLVSNRNNNLRYFKGENKSIKSLGLRMSDIFKLAKEFEAMSFPEINKLLDNNLYEARIGAVSIMDFQARNKKTTDDQKKKLFDLYIRKHDKINNWDLVDRAAPYVIGGYLFDKPRTILYKLAKSKDPWERRTAIVSTYFFIRQNDIDDTFKIAAMLSKDTNEYIHMAVGSWIREAGKRDKQKLINFLIKYRGDLSRVTLRYAVEKLNKKEKDFFLKAK